MFEEDIPENIRVAVEAARDYWEAKIPAQQAIWIQINMSELEENIATQVDVCYYNEDSEVLRGVPTSLASQILGKELGNTDVPDGIIRLNNSLEWNCSFSSSSEDGFSVSYLCLRAISVVLGFGSGVSSEFNSEDGKEYFFFNCEVPSVFDKKIRNGNIYMSDLDEFSDELRDFVLSDNLRVKGENGEYDLYSSNPFIRGKSLVYLNEPTSLMHYELGDGDKFFTIDDITIDVLKGIGWDFGLDEGYASIKCDDIGDDGIGSAYAPHVFSLTLGNPLSCRWKFSLKNDTGNYEEVLNGENTSFVLPVISDVNNYYINTNGDLVGKIECEYVLDGKSYKAKPFSVSLELRPSIMSVQKVGKEIFGDEYTVSFEVVYRGSEMISLEVLEENSSICVSYDFYEPFIAHITTPHLQKNKVYYLTFKAINRYGSVTSDEIIYSEETTTVESVDNTLSKEDISVYSVYGEKVYSGNSNDFKESCLSPGIYLKRENKRISKVIVR
ncbi:MAG: hypothetical protein ACI30M_02830 [Muribaculaceae bacterium]